MGHYLPTILNFLVLCFVLYWYGRKPFLAALAARSERVGHDVQEAQVLARDAQGKLNHWKEQWTGLEQHIGSMQQEMAATIERFRTAAEKATEREIHRIEQEAKMGSATEVARMRQKVQEQIVKQSLRLARKWVEEDWTEKDQKQVVQALAESLGNGHSKHLTSEHSGLSK